MEPERSASLVESPPRSSGRLPPSRRALAALVVLLLAGIAVARAQVPAGVATFAASAVRSPGDSSSRGEDQIFPDGFETGDPYRWSSFQPAVILTLTNYLSWCTFAVDDGAPSGAASLTRAFLPDDVVLLTGAPKPGFVWGYWTGTDADQGGNDPNMQTTVTMSADKSVLECCPVMSGMTCN